jgi:5-(aminomethyl)-3-furanmethanol phosphate kinase
VIDTVVKLGGAVLGARAFGALSGLPADGRTLFVPGGGPFADAVRAVDAELAIGDDAAHWAAILGMDQYAHVLAALIPGVQLVTGPPSGVGLPILAPYQWLRAVDPLPHSWNVTSDSIAAWVASAVGATRLLLVKPGAGGPGLVDPYFGCVRGSINARVIGVEGIAELSTVLATAADWDNLSEP